MPGNSAALMAGSAELIANPDELMANSVQARQRTADRGKGPAEGRRDAASVTGIGFLLSSKKAA